MFPSTLLSTGGDEINMNCYDLDSETQSNLKSSGETFEQALSAFTDSTHSALAKKGKTPVVWEGKISHTQLKRKLCSNGIIYRYRDGLVSQCYSFKLHSGHVRVVFSLKARNSGFLIAYQGLDIVWRCCCRCTKRFPTRSCCFWLLLPRLRCWWMGRKQPPRVRSCEFMYIVTCRLTHLPYTVTAGVIHLKPGKKPTLSSLLQD